MTEGPMQPDVGSPGGLWTEHRRGLPGATEQQVCTGGVSAKHGRLLSVWQCQKLYALTGQVTVTVGTVTFEFPDLCMEFQLHNTTTWIFAPSCPSWDLIFYLCELDPYLSACPSQGRQSHFPYPAPPECQAGDQLGTLACRHLPFISMPGP